MALEFGSGTQADPYLLVNLADVQALFSSYLTSGKYFALVADLDLTGNLITYLNSSYASFHLDGRGFKLFLNLKNTHSATNCIFYGFGSGSFNRVYLKFVNTVRYAISGASPGFNLNDALIEFTALASSGTKSLFIGKNSLIVGGDANIVSSVNTYKDGVVVPNTINTASFPDGNKYNKDNYVGLAEQYWIFDGISLPRPRPQSITDLTTRYAIKGVSNVGGSPRQRQGAVFTENGLRYKAFDTKSDGGFFVNLNDISTPVILLIYDDIGAQVAINTAYSLNQIIHPATPNGFRYRCTLAGNSGATIPPEPWSTTTVLTIGAAKFTPEPVYEPKAHGPLLPVLFNVITEQPV
ncbi:TPA: hypothetical protein ACSP0N_003753 [Aeromonas veronii]